MFMLVLLMLKLVVTTLVWFRPLVPPWLTVLTLSTLKLSPTSSPTGVDNFDVSLGELQEAYNLLTVENVSELDYILQGPGMGNLDDSVSKANFLISIAEERKRLYGIPFPPLVRRSWQPSSATVTENIVAWANELTSSSYAVIDSGYKYTYDRYNDQYRNIPLNGDVAGLMVFTSYHRSRLGSPPLVCPVDKSVT